MPGYIIKGKPDASGLPRISVGKIIFNKLKEFGNRVCLVDAESEEQLTYEDVLDKSVKLADALERLGLHENDVIALMSENNINFFVPFFSCLYYGFKCNLLNPETTNYELTYYLSQTRPKCIFCSKSVLSKILEHLPESPFVEFIVVIDAPAGQGYYSMDGLIKEQPENPNFEPRDFDPEEQIALILYSSGTTGMPKAVALTHKNIRFSIMQTGPEYFGTTEKDILVYTLPVYHVVSMLIVGCCFTYGTKIILLRKFQPQLFLSSLQKHKCTFCAFVPPMIHFICQSPLVQNYDLSSINRIYCGSAPVSADCLETFLKRIPVKCFANLYGLTECSSVITVPALNERNIDSVGMLSSNCEGKFVDLATGNNVGPNTMGELCLRGDCVLKEYYNNEKANKDAFDQEGFFKTGDVGYIDDEERFHIVDRIKDMIKYKAHQVSPVEIETVLKLHNAVKDVAVIGVPDYKAGELPLAFVIKKEEVTEKELLEFVAERLSSYKHLHGGVIFVDDMPKKTLGKTDKSKLREIWKELQQN